MDTMASVFVVTESKSIELGIKVYGLNKTIHVT
jgi:hypothetical protein